MHQQEEASIGQCTPVLLVCIYNKSSTIITHDMLYQIFSQYGLVMKILIFIKAKVWKAFVEMNSLNNSKQAAKNLNNTLLFNDGSKMTIFPSKLQKINFQNSNNGGVNYEQLRKMSQSISKSQNQNIPYNFQELDSYCSMSDTFKSSQTFRKNTSYTLKSSQNTNTSLQQSFSKYQQDDWFSSLRNRKRESTWNSWYDIDSQYQQLAMQSSQYRFLVSRPKSKTTIPQFNQKHQEYFDISNSKVLFVRSIMSYCTIKYIYNVFSNFGNVIKIIHMVQKESMLIQFQHLQDAIQAKDFLNLVKNGLKIFFSHYKTSDVRQPIEGEQVQQYSISTYKKEYFNPPSQILHVSYISQSSQKQFLQLVKQYGTINQIKWQKNHNNKSMLLIRLNNMEQSMKVMGFLQGKKISNKFIKISFTRSKLID